MTKWEFDIKIENIIENNINPVVLGHEDINKASMKQAIIDLIKQLTFTDLSNIHEDKL